MTAAQLIMQSVGQGNALATDIRSLQLDGNRPVPGGFVMAKAGQRKFQIEGAEVTVIGPLENRLEALRKLPGPRRSRSRPGSRARRRCRSCSCQTRSMDKSIPNLSSIVVLVEVGGKKLLLTGDAHGGDVVKGWKELGLGTHP